MFRVCVNMMIVLDSYTQAAFFFSCQSFVKGSSSPASWATTSPMRPRGRNRSLSAKLIAAGETDASKEERSWKPERVLFRCPPKGLFGFL